MSAEKMVDLPTFGNPAIPQLRAMDSPFSEAQVRPANGRYLRSHKMIDAILYALHKIRKLYEQGTILHERKVTPFNVGLNFSTLYRKIPIIVNK